MPEPWVAPKVFPFPFLIVMASYDVLSILIFPSESYTINPNLWPILICDLMTAKLSANRCNERMNGPVYTVFKILWQCTAADLSIKFNGKSQGWLCQLFFLPSVMLGAAAFVVFGLLPAYVAGQLMSTDAKCLSGYEWVCFILQITDFVTHFQQTFNTQNQSPCDVAASLAAVCAPNGRESCLFYTLHIISVNLHAEFDLVPLPPGYVYTGPPREFATPCRCSSVYYSMLSACGYCQFRNFLEWTFCCRRLSLIAYSPF